MAWEKWVECEFHLRVWFLTDPEANKFLVAEQRVVEEAARPQASNETRRRVGRAQRILTDYGRTSGTGNRTGGPPLHLVADGHAPQESSIWPGTWVPADLWATNPALADVRIDAVRVLADVPPMPQKG